MPDTGKRGTADRAEDPTQVRSAVLFWTFGWYLRWYFARNFHGVRLSRTGLPPAAAGRPLIICTNHPSWWDPAVFILLSNTVLRERPGYGPMDAKALGRYGLLRRMGIFGIDLDTPRGAARFLEVSLRILADPASALWITAEGHFTDNRARPVQLRPGIAHLARRVPDAVIVPLALEYGFWNERKPEALARFGTPIEAGRTRSVAEWTQLLSAELGRTMDVLAAESATRNPGLFLPLIRGGSGIGGVYDLWRRGVALASGRRFDPSHEGRER